MTAPWSIEGRTVVVTGGTTGIGRATVEELARRGAKVIFTARRRADGDAVTEAVKAAAPDVDVAFRELHLDDLASVRAFAGGLRTDLDRLDVLVNNAGISLTKRRLTKDGFESMFGVNHLGHFLLVEELRDLLTSSAPARVVIVASGAHAMGGPLDFADLQSEHVRFGVIGGMRAYGRSKLANVLHTRELSSRLVGTGVTANCLHPGFVRTRLARDSEGSRLGDRLVWPIVGRFAMSPEQGAQTSLHLVCSPSLADTSGEYFAKEEVAETNEHGSDLDAAARLWDISSKLVGSRPD